MKLIDKNPRWLDNGGEGVTDADNNPVPVRERIGITFDCPCGCDQPIAITFSNPDDGKGPIYLGHPAWERSGDTFESLTLTPSILRVGGCEWHGWITNGEIRQC